jgi:hypothetical protein
MAKKFVTSLLVGSLMLILIKTNRLSGNNSQNNSGNVYNLLDGFQVFQILKF